MKLIKITAAHDVGKAINPLLAEGQIEGGIAQGIGMALMEEYIPGRTENLHDYLIPTIGDVPEIESILIEVPDPEGPFGAKGLGEHVLIPTAPAILNAIRHATGVLVTKVPATPSRVRAAIREAEARPMSELSERFETHDPGAKQVGEKIRCDACPVMCYIADGRTGACDRYGNPGGRIVRLDPLTILEHAPKPAAAVPFDNGAEWNGDLVNTGQRFVTGDRRRHHLSRLQAGALHRQPGGRGRRPRHRRHRGHLLLLRRQGEDRHRPPSRSRDRDGARRRARRSAMSPPANTARRCCRSAACII